MQPPQEDVCLQVLQRRMRSRRQSAQFKQRGCSHLPCVRRQPDCVGQEQRSESRIDEGLPAAKRKVQHCVHEKPEEEEGDSRRRSPNFVIHVADLLGSHGSTSFHGDIHDRVADWRSFKKWFGVAQMADPDRTWQQAQLRFKELLASGNCRTSNIDDHWCIAAVGGAQTKDRLMVHIMSFFCSMYPYAKPILPPSTHTSCWAKCAVKASFYVEKSVRR